MAMLVYEDKIEDDEIKYGLRQKKKKELFCRSQNRSIGNYIYETYYSAICCSSSKKILFSATDMLIITVSDTRLHYQ